MWLSQVLRSVAFAQTTDEVVTWLVTLSHDQWSAPFRLARDTDVTSRGQVYRASGVDVRFPELAKGGLRPGAILLPNISDADRQVVSALRALASDPPRVLVELIMLSDPDTPHVTVTGARLASPRVTAGALEADLVAVDYAILRHAGHAFVPSQHPGLF